MFQDDFPAFRCEECIRSLEGKLPSTQLPESITRCCPWPLQSMFFCMPISNLLWIQIYQTWFILITKNTWKGWKGWKKEFVCKKRCPSCRSQLLDHLVDPSIIFQEFVSSVAWPGYEEPPKNLLPCWGEVRQGLWCEFFTVFFWEKIPKTDVANMLGLSFGEGCSCNPVLWEVKTKQNGRGWYVPPHFPIPAGLQQWPSPPSSSLRALHCTRITSPWPGEPMRNDKICFWEIENLQI